MSKYNAKAILLGLNPSLEDNDLNININAEHEGDASEGEDLGGFGGEEAEAPAEVAEVETAEVAEDTSGTPEAAELDVADAGEEVGESVDQVEDAVETAEGLESIALTLAQISVEGVEVTPLIGQMLNSQYTMATRKFPALRSERHAIASCESLVVGQSDAVTVSLEKVMDSLKSAGAATIKFLKELWTRFMALLGNLNAGVKVMANKAKALNAKTAGKQVESVNIPGILGGKPTATSVYRLVTLIKEMNGLSQGELLQVVSKDNASEADVKGAFEKINNKIKTITQGQTYLGNFKITISENGVPELATGDMGEGSKEKGLTGSECKELSKAVMDLAAAMEAYRSVEKGRKKFNDALIAALAKVNTTDDDGALAKARKLRAASKTWARQIAFEQKVISKALAVGNAINNVVSASIGSGAKGTAAGDNSRALATV